MSRFQPFHIFQRKNSKDRIIFYVRFLCPDTGKTFRTMSSGLSNRVAAARWAEAKLPEIQAEQELQHRGHIPTLERYAESYFSDDGPYASNRRERGYTVAQVYLYTARCYTRNHIVPTWGHYHLDQLTAEDIDREIIALYKAGKLASATVNRILRYLRLFLNGT